MAEYGGSSPLLYLRLGTLSNDRGLSGTRDIAAHVPYDHIYVLSNTQKYGGGGIYNFYGISAAHHPNRTGKIYVHEFGHVLLGLGAEYIGNVSYNDMYPTDVEPWEANLTTPDRFRPEGMEKDAGHENAGSYSCQ